MPGSVVVPLESNPDVSKKAKIPKTLRNVRNSFVSSYCLEVLNKYLGKLGVSESYQLVDVYGFEEDVLAFIPKPIKALILLFPVSGKMKSSFDFFFHLIPRNSFV